MSKKALIIGNSDGIGLRLTKRLLDNTWSIIGISRSFSPLNNSEYKHIVSNVEDESFTEHLKTITSGDNRIDLCVYCVGIGEPLNLEEMQKEIDVFNVNLMGLIKTATVIVPKMVKRGSGHLIGLSSLADDMLSPEAPSYHATKAGFTCYLESLALALRPKSVAVTNVRFGFVDTKMAKGDLKPFMMSVEKAVGHIMKCIKKKPVRYSAPKIVIPLIKIRKFMLNLRR